MPELCVVIEPEMPKRMYGAFEGYAVQTLSEPLVVAIEDYLFKATEDRVKLAGAHASIVIIPDVNVNASNIEDQMTIVEFALALLLIDGHPTLPVGAILSGDKCIFAKVLPSENAAQPCVFPRKLNGAAATQWLRRCFLAQRKLRERMHVTAHRYVTYSRLKTGQDALLDLSISLESLLDSQTEIAFRFAASLSKVTGARGSEAHELASILTALYDIRSKIVHGDHQVGRLTRKIEPKLPDLHRLARRILTTYVLYVSDKTREEWKTFVRNSLFA
jgi:hypothetical protein